MTALPLLVLDTTNAWCAAALNTGAGVFECAEELGRGHAGRLAPMIAELCETAAIKPSALARIGVNTGPGSFAGARVGVAFARGLALSTGARAVGIGLLPALAYTADPKGQVMAIHDARRGDLVWQVFKAGQAQGAPTKSDLETARAAFQALNGAKLIGSGAQLIDPDLPEFDTRPPLAALMALTEQAPETAPLPAPIYARPPDAKLPGGVDPDQVQESS